MGKVFHQLVILCGSGYLFFMVLRSLKSPVLAELVKLATVLGAGYYIICWCIMAFEKLNDKCNNWFKIF